VKSARKLIEVALPLDAINKASVRENYIYRGNPSALHKWWAQRPLSAARAVIFAQMVDDPSSHPDIFRTEKAQEQERQRLFRIIEDLVQWENTANAQVIEQARAEIWQSWRAACAENVDHPRAKELFDRFRLPEFHDPFAGGGTLPLEAQRLGLKSRASDLNPVAVLINKAMIEIPTKFAGRSPINKQARSEKTLAARQWNGADGLADDVRYYGKWMRDEAEKRIGNLYPKIEITSEMAKTRPELRPLVGEKLNVIAWLWARTVKSPNPAFAEVDVPLASTFMLSTKTNKEAFVESIIERSAYRFIVKIGKPNDPDAAKRGTRLARGANFRCILSDTPISGDYIKTQGKAGRMGARLMAIVVEGGNRRLYLSPTPEHEEIAREAKPEWKPDLLISGTSQYLGVKPYGVDRFDQLFSDRQLVSLTTFSDLVQEVMARVKHDALDAGLTNDDKLLSEGGAGAQAYGEAVGVYLAMAEDKVAEYGCTSVPWYTKEDRPKGLFARQAIPMVWDYAEVNPFGDIGGTLSASIRIVAEALSGCAADGATAVVEQLDAVNTNLADGAVVSTDPPYFDNVPYADLSDFFYVWLRRSLKPVFPSLFTTLAVPKVEELVAFAYRHDGKVGAEKFFLDGMTKAMQQLAEKAHPAFPVSVYYAFKQAESDDDKGTVSTGWDVFLEALIHAGFAITGTWPMRTERGSRMRDVDSNALASSIILICRKRDANAVTATRREFVTALKADLPLALNHLQKSNIAPVDLAQAAIGPGMAVYTRYAKIIDAEGKSLPVREALALINQVLDEALAKQEGDFDADSRWALAWFGDNGFAEGSFGDAHTYFVRFNTAENALKQAGIIQSGRGKVRLLRPNELLAEWNPESGSRLTAWEIVHHLIRSLETSGESAAAVLVARLGSKAEVAKELAYRLYALSERKKRAAEALSYNGLVQSWPEISRLAREDNSPQPEQAQLI
jgi:putative DNA methylase